MYYRKEICCFCLTATLPLTDLHSMDQRGIRHFDKIASSMPKIAHVMEWNFDYKICNKCSETVDMIYDFNETSLQNIKMLRSYKMKKMCNTKVEFEELEYSENKKFELVSVKSEPLLQDEMICKSKDGFDGDPSTSESVPIKEEIEDTSIIDEDDNIDSLNKSNVKIEIKKKAVNQKYSHEIDGDISDVMNQGLQSGIHGHFEDYSRFALNVGTSNSTKRTEKDEAEHLLEDDEEDLHINESDNLEQILVRNKQIRKDKIHTCHVCNKIFTRKSLLDGHLRIHTGEKPFICEFCEASFNLKSNLRRHVLIHSDEKQFLCNVCSKSFTQKQTLVAHKRIHTGDKPYICDVCYKAFSYKSHLTQHKRRHTGEKPYSCDICNKTFAQKQGLRQHKQKYKH